MKRLVLLLLFALVLVFPSVADAHVRSVSWSNWELSRGELEIRVKLARLDLSAIPGLDEANIDAYVRSHLQTSCVIDGSRAEVADPGYVVRVLHAHCAEGAPLRVGSDLLLDKIPSHLHFATVSRDGAVVAELMLSRDNPVWSERAAMRATALVSLGVHHILSGADHLVFLLTLIVAATSLRALAGVVTGFTLGHSVALGLAVLLGVRPNAAVIEALVGATIAIVAVENVWLARRDPLLPRALLVLLAIAFAGRAMAPTIALGMLIFVACYFGLLARTPNRTALRGTVTALFGVVHGFAFSSVLVEMALPRARLATALFSFNVGVELGQLAIVALAWPLWRVLSRTRLRDHALELASATALALGVFWFVARAFA